MANSSACVIWFRRSNKPDKASPLVKGGVTDGVSPKGSALSSDVSCDYMLQARRTTARKRGGGTLQLRAPGQAQPLPQPTRTALQCDRSGGGARARSVGGASRLPGGVNHTIKLRAQGQRCGTTESQRRERMKDDQREPRQRPPQHGHALARPLPPPYSEP